MADTSYTGRKTWEAPRRHPPKPSARARLVRLARRVSFTARRNGGFIALAAVAGCALLLHNGYLHPSRGSGKLATERFTATEPFTATERLTTTERFIATAIDGDSLRAAGKEIRLAGIDAPELLQTCRDQHGATWACGRHAHDFLRSLVSRGNVTCASNSTDRYGRTLATCSAGDVGDIGDAMVRSGYAVSFMGVRYWAAEVEARYHKRGIWSGSFESPSDWRRRHPRR